MKALMTLAEAAAETPYSVDHLRRCTKASDPTIALPAKRGARGRILVTDKALREWIDRHPDA